MSRTTSLAIACVAVIGLGGLAGCGPGSPLSQNQGGDTTCGDFLEMAPDEQQEVIAAFMDEMGRSDAPGFETTLVEQSSKLYCNTMGRPSDPIRNINTG